MYLYKLEYVDQLLKGILLTLIIKNIPLKEICLCKEHAFGNIKRIETNELKWR